MTLLKKVLLIVLAMLPVCLSLQPASAQTVNWNGMWVGSYFEVWTDSCGHLQTTPGLMAFQFVQSSNTVAGAGGVTGFICYQGGSCSFLDYEDAAVAVAGTVSKNTINFTTTGVTQDGSCKGSSYNFAISGTNFGVTIAGAFTNLSQGPNFHGAAFLENFGVSPPPNKIAFPQRLPNGAFDMVFFGAVGSNYALQASTDLKNWASRNNFTCTNSPMIVMDTAATNDPGAFYRIVPDPFGNNCFPAPPGLVGWWPGNGNATDVVGGNNGTLLNGATYAPGLIGEGFSFTNANDQVSIPQAASIDLSRLPAWTVEAWVNPVTFNGPTWQTIYSKGHWVFSLGLNLGTGKLESWINNANPLVGSIPLKLAQWNHVALVNDGVNRTFYVNGVFAGMGATEAVNPDNNGSIIGNVTGPNSSTFQGVIDEVSVYNRALSASEISSIYLSRSHGKCPVGGH